MMVICKRAKYNQSGLNFIIIRLLNMIGEYILIENKYSWMSIVTLGRHIIALTRHIIKP